MDDLRARLARTRWPNGVQTEGGFPSDRVRELVRYWSQEYDWYVHQERLNQLPNFLATVGGERIHFVRFSGGSPSALPLLLLHGWPGSFLEFVAVGRALSRDRDVVVPSIPGFGFSTPPPRERGSNRALAAVMDELMITLGFARYVVHGGDIGAGIASWMARDRPQRIAGIHLNYIPGSYAPTTETDLTSAEQSFMRERSRFADESGAYAHIQRTRPLTLAYGISDSPLGLLAWIAEKFSEWAAPTSRIDRDDLITNVSIYWLTNTFASSARFYLESERTPLAFAAGERIAAPVAVARFPYELPMPPREYVERAYNVVRWSEMARGGHFAALEEPELLASDIRAFFASID